MKVYIVLSGCVGDIGIANVFKTFEIAEKWVIENKKSLYEPSICEYEVYGKAKGIKPWQGGII